jgi:hypothetical protein
VCIYVCGEDSFFHIPSFSLKGPSFHSHQMAVPLRVCAYAEQLGEDIPAGSAKDTAGGSSWIFLLAMELITAG